jgi:hypothetical protein
MQVSLGRLEVDAVCCEQPLARNTEELMLVQESILDREIGPLRYVLESRDAIHYPGATPHRFFPVVDQDLIFVSTVSPPVAAGRTDAS